MFKIITQTGSRLPETCQNKNWVLRGDFDGDGKLDYLLRMRSGKSVKSSELNLLAFLNYHPNYIPANIIDFKYNDERTRRSSFQILKKGETVALGEGPVKLKTDAVTHYICETDDVSIYVMKEGKWRGLYDQ